MKMSYNVGDLKKLISESSQEFKAKIGDGVESEDKKNNGKAYSDAKKRAKDYDGGLEDEVVEEKPKYVKTDPNKTTLDYNVDNASEEWKNRVKAQAKGYTSEQEMNNGLAKEGDFSDNENIYNGIKDCGHKMHDNEKNFKKSGLRGRAMPADTYDRGEMYESRDGFDMRNMIDAFKSKSLAPAPVIKENQTVQVAYFKKMTFLNEDHMLSRIPDDFKNEGQQFKMKDKVGNEFLVEWNNNEGRVLKHSFPAAVNEEFNRMKALMNYTTKDTSTNNHVRMNEGNEAFTATLDKARKIIK